MSLREQSPVRRTNFLGRSVNPHGKRGASIRIPSTVVKELEIEAGTDGDVVDVVYDRDEPSLTVYFHRDSVPDPTKRVRDELQDLDLDDEQLDAIVDRLG